MSLRVADRKANSQALAIRGPSSKRGELLLCLQLEFACLQLSFVAYSPIRRLEALAHCKQKNSKFAIASAKASIAIQEAQIKQVETEIASIKQQTLKGLLCSCALEVHKSDHLGVHRAITSNMIVLQKLCLALQGVGWSETKNVNSRQKGASQLFPFFNGFLFSSCMAVNA